ncbi:MAG: hypothetical protein GXZ14_12300 [Ruminococcaceae bacterium]|nr:hypothetical protein [Oscillospiraceae bacterium]
MKKGDTIIFDTPPSVLASASVGKRARRCFRRRFTVPVHRHKLRHARV